MRIRNSITRSLSYVIKPYSTLIDKINGYLASKVKNPKKLAIILGITYGLILSAFDYYWSRGFPIFYQMFPGIAEFLRRVYHLTIYKVVWLYPTYRFLKNTIERPEFTIYGNILNKVKAYLGVPYNKTVALLATAISSLSWLINDSIGWFLIVGINEGWERAIRSLEHLYTDPIGTIWWYGISVGIPGTVMTIGSLIRLAVTLGIISNIPQDVPISERILATYYAAQYKQGVGLDDRLERIRV